jgi:peptidylprolyl isomerase
MTPALIAPFLAASGFLALAAAPAAAPSPPPVAAAPISDWRPVDPANTLILDTSKGRIVVELRPEIAPQHVARMKALARQGKMTNMPFYRVLKGFMAQGGNMKVASGLPNLKREFEFSPAAAPLYAPVGPAPEGEFGYVGALPVKLDPGGAKGHARFCPGVAALAHQVDDPDSANAQYFFMRGRASNLEGTFTAWGRVIVGQDVVGAIEDGSPPAKPDTIVRARVMADIPAAQRPAIEVMDTRGPAFAAVVEGVKKERREVFSPCDVELPSRVVSPGA